MLVKIYSVTIINKDAKIHTFCALKIKRHKIVCIENINSRNGSVILLEDIQTLFNVIIMYNVYVTFRGPIFCSSQKRYTQIRKGMKYIAK